MTRTETLRKIHQMAASLNEKFDRDIYDDCFDIANRFNRDHEDEQIDVFMMDDEMIDGIRYGALSVEDEIYRFAYFRF